jgi:hypothetical protein
VPAFQDLTGQKFSRLTVVKRAPNKSLKIVGVYFNKSMGKFQAAVTVAGKQIHLGTFAKVKDAVAARRAAENRHWSATSIS